MPDVVVVALAAAFALVILGIVITAAEWRRLSQRDLPRPPRAPAPAPESDQPELRLVGSQTPEQASEEARKAEIRLKSVRSAVARERQAVELERQRSTGREQESRPRSGRFERTNKEADDRAGTRHTDR